MKVNQWKTEFVQVIPKHLDKNTFYVCLNCDIVIHLCACGCGSKVVTPIDIIHGWKFEYDGYGISLYPSIGNYNFPCKSHYFVRNGKIEWVQNDKKSNVSSHSFIDLLKHLLK